MHNDSAGGRDLRRASLGWKFFVLVLIGACGIYMCFARVNQRNFQQFSSTQEVLENSFCRTPSNLSLSDFAQHFPRPLTYQRGICICTPVHYFVIFSMQRSGSGWFETLLNSHPNISSHGEIFIVKDRRQNFTTISHTLDKLYNLDWFSSSAKNECTAAVGLKWMLNQGAMDYHTEIAAYLRKRGISVLFLIRRNTLRRLISILANAYDRERPIGGTHVSHVHSKEQAKRLASYKPTVNVKYLNQNLERYEEISNNALQAFNVTRLLVIFYEDLVKEPQKLMEVQEFLGVPPRKLESRQVKIHTGPLSGLITNREEVYRALQATKFEGFLREDDP
ncbi:hypothetical protein O6H91_12G100100 [Diphasiastrum complanatum]|uniref:Uncharacterized protein n=1 Tax=Diphasiastrum complanatum TaxID=34168 RepID=A0ACC2C546_DIPCM|nr:hypothetical protein O6H91_12G100100 [Diphasiastrum complanatum]